MATSHGHGHYHDPVPTGPHGEEVAGSFVPSGPTHDLGYEPDKFGVKTILAVPAAVIVTGILAFIVTNLIFGAFFSPTKFKPRPTSEQGAAENAAPLDERLGRISSTDPNARVLQPRLEGLQRRQVYGEEGDPITDQITTTQPTPKGNSPQFRAEEVRPDRVPATATAASDPKTGVNRIPVNEAIRRVTNPTDATWARAIQSAEGAKKLDVDSNWERPKESNGGNSRFPLANPPVQPNKDGGPEAKKGGALEKGPDPKGPEAKGPENKEPAKK